MISNYLICQWQSLCQSLAADPIASQAVWLEIVAAYSSANRYYHNLTHIQQILIVINRLKSLATNHEAIALAAWFHDIVYNPKAQDNEQRSAEFAAAALTQMGLPLPTINIVKQLILLTQTHQTSNLDSEFTPNVNRKSQIANPQLIDRQILLDADLSILGSNPQEYENYARAIRQEYSWLDDAAYRAGRKQVLINFLTREKIFSTLPIQASLENIARQNIQTEIKSL